MGSVFCAKILLPQDAFACPALFMSSPAELCGKPAGRTCFLFVKAPCHSSMLRPVCEPTVSYYSFALRQCRVRPVQTRLELQRGGLAMGMLAFTLL